MPRRAWSVIIVRAGMAGGMAGREAARDGRTPEWRVAMLPALAVSFALIAASITAMALISDSVTRETINTLVGEQSTFASHAAISRIDEEIDDRIGDLRALGSEPRIRAALAHHNAGGEAGPLADRATEALAERPSAQGAAIAGVALVGSDGATVASAGRGVVDSGVDRGALAHGAGVRVSDVRHDPIYGMDVIDIGVTVRDAAGAPAGALVAAMGLEEVYRIAASTQEGVRLGRSTVDIYRVDGWPIYSSAPHASGDAFEIVTPDLMSVPEGVQDELARRFAEIDDEYDRVLGKYGFEEPMLNETEAIEYAARVLELDERYGGAIAEAGATGPTGDLEAAVVEDLFEAYDAEYRKIAADYGILAPDLTPAEEEALAAELARIEARYATVYEGLDVDYTFGERGFVIVGHGSEETLHSFSRQSGYGDFAGLGWTFVVHTNLADALAEANTQRNFLLALAAVVGIAAAGLSAYLARAMYAQTRRLRQSEKIAAIGQLASNIAHDLRNPLGIIRNSAERIRRKAGGDAQVDGELDRINRAITRMSHQIEGVLNYVRTTPVIADECAVVPMLEYALDSIDVPRNIGVSLPSGEAVIECDREKIEIMFANLLLNAVQAIGEGEGRIDVRMEAGEDAVTVEFENSGPPIPEGSLERIFEPLYTTKLKGTGLGLSGCRNIVRQHGGTIRARSGPVVFSVVLPRRQRA